MWLSFFVNSLLIIIIVLIHYETLRQLSIVIPRLSILPRLRILVGIIGALCGHVAEIWVFGLAYYWISDVGELGSLQGNWDGTLLDSVYFSFSCYTSLGFGDIEPIGHLRFLAGLEALVGLVLISWTASFLFLEMTRYWREK
ncbi:MAG: hypothetical protein ACJA04_000113 [Cellvibrionaceae bacterium]|jgi:hypothetical protein